LKSKLTATAFVLVAALVATAFAAGGITKGSAGTLDGAGSTFVFPLVSTWSPVYDAATGVHVNYNPIGSGGGISAISNRTVDFGASDAPMTSDQFAACHGCVQIPWALSATSVAYNLSGSAPHLRMNGAVLAKIFLGKITDWNDPAIKKLNPGKTLPAEKITPIFRSDSSGTTYNFTDYLSSVSPEFKSAVGKGTQVNFPVGVGGKGSSGVAAVLARTNGGITYVDVAYSLKNHFKIAKLKNRAGKFQLPGIKQIQAAADSIIKLKNSQNAFTAVDPNPRAPKAYPICTFTWVIVPLKTGKAPDLKKFITWALNTGQTYGPKLLFVPVPKAVKTAGLKTLARIHT